MHPVDSIFLNRAQNGLGPMLAKNFFIKADDADFWHNFIHAKETIFFEMESKLNVDVIKDYSKAFSDKILKNYFSTHEVATGDDLLRLSDVRQVNLFVVYQLFESWNEEMDKLESPFFDFKDKEVKQAIKELGNTLSRHIRVKEKTLSGMFEIATEDTLFLILSPYDFYCSKINNWSKGTIKLKDLKALAKYVKINKSLMTSFISKLEQNEKNEVNPENALKLLNEIFAETSQTPEDIDAFVAQFSAVIPLNINAIYGEEVFEPPKSTGESVKTEPHVTLNDQLAKKGEKPTVAELHNKKRIDNIKSNLSINQKFMFVNQLFGGNADDFNKVVDFLDNCSSQAEAMDFINSNYLKKSNWKKDSMEVREFIDVIAKKYGADKAN